VGIIQACQNKRPENQSRRKAECQEASLECGGRTRANEHELELELELELGNKTSLKSSIVTLTD
jgi:hypothetical protein